MKVAIVHDWMTLKGGGELCVEEFLHLYPDADLYCVVEFLPEEDRAFLNGRKVHTSFVQRLPWARTRYRSYLPLMPIAVEQFDLSGYDLIISSSHAVAKGVITGPDQVHLAYVHAPIRYAWDLQHTYLQESGLTKGPKSAVARAILHYMRIWDARTANGVDRFLCNSAFTARRIRKVYGREATVVYPPVKLDRFTLGERREEFYLCASRMVPYKRIPLIAQAFAEMPDRRLVIIGDGPDMEDVRRAAAPNVEILGRIPDDQVRDYMRRAKAFIFAAEEDFGIAPVEAQACGVPVVAYAKGGALETVRGYDGPDQTGVFFHEQTPQALSAAVRHLDQRLSSIDPLACRANAERFGAERFRREIAAAVEEALAEVGIWQLPPPVATAPA